MSGEEMLLELEPFFEHSDCTLKERIDGKPARRFDGRPDKFEARGDDTDTFKWADARDILMYQFDLAIAIA